MTEPANTVIDAQTKSVADKHFPYVMTDKEKAELPKGGLGEPGTTRIDQLTFEHYRRGVKDRFDDYRLLP